MTGRVAVSATIGPPEHRACSIYGVMTISEDAEIGRLSRHPRAADAMNFVIAVRLRVVVDPIVLHVGTSFPYPC